MLSQVHQSLVLLEFQEAIPREARRDHNGRGFTVTDFVHPPVWEGYSQCGHMVLGLSGHLVRLLKASVTQGMPG